jgi:hypothetical protein
MSTRSDEHNDASDKLDAKLLLHHKIGMQVVNEQLNTGGRGKDWMREQAEKLQVSESMLYRARQLAMDYFGDTRVKTLRGLSWDKVKILLTVQDEEKRTRLQQRAIKECWTKIELQRQAKMCRRLKRRRRRHVERGSRSEEVAKLAKVTEDWLRNAHRAWPPGMLRSSRQKSPEIEMLSRVIAKACQALEKLEELLRRPVPGWEV